MCTYRDRVLGEEQSWVNMEGEGSAMRRRSRDGEEEGAGRAGSRGREWSKPSGRLYEYNRTGTSNTYQVPEIDTSHYQIRPEHTQTLINYFQPMLDFLDRRDREEDSESISRFLLLVLTPTMMMHPARGSG